LELLNTCVKLEILVIAGSWLWTRPEIEDALYSNWT